MRKISNYLKKRPKDINLNLAIGQNDGVTNYYQVGSATMNFCSNEDLPSHKYKSKNEIRVSKLSTVLKSYLPLKKEIDLLTIDTEGWEYDVLKSNDWNGYKPKVIIIEQSLEDLTHEKSIDFLTQKGYQLFSFTTLGLRHSNILSSLYFCNVLDFPSVRNLENLITAGKSNSD
jgi:FkbM family methyltransferase